MVDKKTPNKTTKPVVKKVKESKEQLFNRLAKVRVEKVLKAMRILGNCSNRNNYAYSQEQIDTMENAISIGFSNLFAKFTQSKKEQESFDF